MNILFISLLDPSESGSGNQKVTLLSAKYLSSVGIHCFIAYFKDSEYSSSQLVFDAKFKIDYNDLEEIEKYKTIYDIKIVRYYGKLHIIKFLKKNRFILLFLLLLRFSQSFILVFIYIFLSHLIITGKNGKQNR